MDFESIKAWLTRETGRQIRIRWLLVLLGLILTPLGLAAGFFVVFFIGLLATRSEHSSATDTKCLWIALGSIPVLFVVNRFMPHNQPEKYYHDEPDNSVVGSYVARQRVKFLFVLWVLFTGPRLVDWVIFSVRRIFRLKKQDTHSCAALLWLLMLKGKRVTHPAIIQELEWLDLEATLPQLAWIPGVLFFTTPPGAVSLTEDLRTIIRAGARL